MSHKIISLFFRPVLIILLLVGSPMLCNTAAHFPVAAKPSCEQTNQRTISLGVTDKADASVENLRLEDLSLSENKTPREIIKLELRTNKPLSVAILIDTSASQERSLAGAKLAAQKFVEAILRSDKDRIAVVSFTGDATIEQDLTNDLTRLRIAINRVKLVRSPGFLTGGVVLGPPPNRDAMMLGSTAIWDAVWATVDGIHPAPDSRRVIVLLTDGEDTSSKTKMRAAIEHAAVHDVAIFSIGIADEKFVGLNRDSLKKLSEETGGGAFFPKKVADLDGIFSQIAQALQSQYLLTYCAASSRTKNRPFKIQIEVKSPQSSARLSYPRYAL